MKNEDKRLARVMCEVQTQSLLFRKPHRKQFWNESCLIIFHTDIIKSSNKKICIFILRIHFKFRVHNMEEQLCTEQDKNLLIFAFFTFGS